MVAPLKTNKDLSGGVSAYAPRATLVNPMAGIKDAIEGPIVRNAAALYGTTIVTSILGFVYWFVAARLAPAAAVGTASADPIGRTVSRDILRHRAEHAPDQ